MTTDQPDVEKLEELIHRIFMAGYQSGKKSGLTMVIASDIVEPAAEAELHSMLIEAENRGRIDELNRVLDAYTHMRTHVYLKERLSELTTKQEGEQ